MAASIMSKKLAEGASGLVLDVKVGSGAFLKQEKDAKDLAQLMISIARGMNRDCIVLITDMNQPLGRAVGNSLELIEAFETLKGRGPDDFNTLCRELASEMFVLGNAAPDTARGRQLYDKVIASGAGVEKMRDIIRAQGGDPLAIDDYSLLPRAANEQQLLSSESGYVQAIDTEAIGHASMLLGAGRARLDTPIDLGVGLTVHAKLGDKVERNSPLVTIHFEDPARAEEAASDIRDAYTIGPEQITPPDLIKAVAR
jgi:pyrimidine-nucleoside phosphorylase